MMIKRFTRPDMGALWTELRKKALWHQVDTAVLGARGEFGEIPVEIQPLAAAVVVTEEILKRADEIEAEIDHDLLAFVLAIAEQLVEEARRFYHDRMTSFDTQDTALAMNMVLALELIIGALEKMCEVVRRRAVEHRLTLKVARTHMAHAKPYTLGLWFLNLYDECEAHLARLKLLHSETGVGKISGATGAHTLNPKIEEITCRLLGLQAARISTQVISRRIHTRYANELADLALTLRKYAQDLRLMAGTDIGEVSEYKSPTAKGSSAMPGKSMLGNSIKCENTCSLSYAAEGYRTMATLCQPMWLERTLDNSAVERIWIQDLSTIIHFMLVRFSDTLDKLVVYPEQMLANLWRTTGLVFAEDVLGELTKAGMARPDAYGLLEGLAKKLKRGAYLTENGKTYRELVCSDSAIRERLSDQMLEQLFDPWNSLKYLDQEYARFGL